MCKQFMKEFEDQWDIIAAIFQWSVRTNCKVYNGSYTPYEVITGMKPRTPVDTVLGSPMTLEKVTTDDYVRDLCQYIKRVHQFVQEEHARVREAQVEYRERRFGAGTTLEVGDYVMLKINTRPEPGRSLRFRSTRDPRLFQIHAVSGTNSRDRRTYTLMDPCTGSTEFDFVQPVHQDRLIPVEVLPISQPIDEKTKLKIDDRIGEVTATCIDGRVHVQWEDTGDVQVIDLARVPHEFVV